MKRITCLIRTIWLTLSSAQFYFGGFPVMGHRYLAQEDGSLLCEICGYISK